MLAPQTIVHNRYEIVQPIGHGGMGAVYEAQDRRLKIRVALKQLTLQGAAVSRAFEREAQLLAGLRHPALPRVIDHFSEPTGQYLVMEYIPGQDLGAMLRQRRQPFPLATVLSWADQLLEALDYLHQQQPPILHRDIKPQNLKLMPDGKLVLLDFGLAKGITRPLQGATTSSVLGYTPHYASLEQIQGKGTSVQSDLYSVAATLYHLLTNTPPPDALERASILLQGQPDPLLAAHALQRQVPPSLGMALAQALAINPAQRPSSAAALRALLKAPPGTAGTTVVATPGASSAGNTTIPVSPPGSGTADRAGTHPSAPAAPRPARRLGLALVAALIVGAAIVLPRSGSDSWSAGLLGGGPPTSVPASPTGGEPPPTAEPATPVDEPTIAYKPTAESQILEEHSDAVNRVAWSPDGQTLASGSRDFSVLLWDVSTAERQRRFDTTGPTVALTFASDGSVLQHASSYQLVRWNPLTGSFAAGIDRWTLPSSAGVGEPWGIAWSPDGQHMAVETGSGMVTLFHSVDMKEQARIEHSGAATTIAFNSTGELLAIGTEQGDVHIWSLAEKQVIKNLKDTILFQERAPITSLAWNPVSGQIASGSLDNRIELASLSDGIFATIEGHALGVYSLAWSPDGALLASGGGDGEIHITPVSDTANFEVLLGHSEAVYDLAWSPDGRTLASAGEDMTVRLWPREQ